MLAIAAGKLMSRLREGRANTARGAAHPDRVRYGGARTTHCGRTLRPHCRCRLPGNGCPSASAPAYLIEAIPEEDWTPIPYWMDGAADVAETTYTPFQTKPDAAPSLSGG